MLQNFQILFTYMFLQRKTQHFKRWNVKKKPKIVAQVKGAKFQIWRTIPFWHTPRHISDFFTRCSSTLRCSTLTHTSLTTLDINIKSHGQNYAHRTHSKSAYKSYRTDCYIIPSCKLHLVNPFSKSQYTKKF